jgi:hypothetical protein
MYKFIKLEKATDGIHKYQVTLFNEMTNRNRTIKFGAKGYQDYLEHHDKIRRGLYIARHSAREKWLKDGIGSAGFWSRWLLWGDSTSLTENLKNIRDKFKL